MDWLSPQHLLLLAAPLAMVLAALALAAGQRRAEARRARASLGKPLRHVAEAAEGQRVLLEGTLDTLEGPCPRFEDGAPCAAATVETTGPRAAPGSIPATWKPAPGVGLARRARAPRWSSPWARTACPSKAPSRSSWARARPTPAPRSRPSPATCASASPPRQTPPPLPGAGPLPASPAALDADRARHAIPLFRSLAAGDRVRAAGVLAKQSEGDRTGYRERARWASRATRASPIVLAYAGAPATAAPSPPSSAASVPSPWWPCSRRSRSSLGLAVGAAAAASRPPPRPAAPPPVNGMASHFADPARCASLQKEHTSAVRDLTVCTVDSECTSERRGGAHFGLEGCYRFRNRTLSPTRADAAEKAWLDEGCAASYEICPEPPPSMCREGRCVERPPAPIPESWHREDVPGGFFMYVPPGVTRGADPGDDALDASYKGNGIRIVSDFAAPGAVLSDEAGEGRAVQIGGHPARVWRNPSEITLSFERGPSCQPPRCSRFTDDDRLTLHADCEGEAACDNAWLALQSVRFW